MLLIYMSFIDDGSHRRLFEEIYFSYRKQMFLVARTVLKNDSDAEDIVHDVFLRIAKKYMAKISTIENETDLRNYLLKATKNAALDHLRKHRHERVRTKEENETDVPDSEEMPDDALVEKIHDRIEYKKIVSAIASMSDIYRDALYYHFVLELSGPETAKLLNCKVSTVKQRLVRGKKLLHVQLFERGEQ